MLRTLQCFFEVPVEGWIDGHADLFDDLAVMEAQGRHVAQRGAHPVIYLGLNQCGGETWEATRDSIAHLIADEYNRHAYIMDSPRISTAWSATASRARTAR